MKTSESPIDAFLVLQPGDAAIANADYEIRSEHNGQNSGIITSWPHTLPRDQWQNRNPGNLVVLCTPSSSTRLKIRPKIPNPRPLSFFARYQPIKPPNSLLTCKATRATELDLVPDQDSDGDSISDSDELLAGLNPTMVDSDGDGTLDINEDSDGDGIINLHEMDNSSSIHKPDTDGDLRMDGNDWMETVDVEGSRQEVVIPYDINNRMAAYPTPAEQIQFQANLTAAVPSFDGKFFPNSLQTVPENAPDAGAVILAERVHRISDLNQQWLQIGNYRKTTYRLRTGHAAAGTATGPDADPEAQNETVSILIHRATYAGNAFSPGAVPVDETYEIQSLPLSNGFISITTTPPALPQNLVDYTFPNGEVGYHHVTTATQNNIRLIVDTNMNGFLEGGMKDESPADQAHDFTKTAPTPVNNGGPYRKAGDAGLILDINNDNSDGGSGSPTSDKYDHISETMDGDADEREFTQSGPHAGHTNGKAKINISNATLRAMKPNIQFPQGQYSLRLVSANSNCLRVHRKPSSASAELLVGLGTPGARSGVMLRPEWFSSGGDKPEDPKYPYSTMFLIIEGVLLGSDTLTLELVSAADDGDDDPITNGVVELSDIVKVQVNVDQVPASNLQTRHGIQLGQSSGDGPVPTKHYIGANYPTFLMTEGKDDEGKDYSIIALRGSIKAETPSQRGGQTNWFAWLSHKGRKLRVDVDGQRVNTASFWIGIQGADPAFNSDQDPLGSFSTWVQTGVMLEQEKNQDWPNSTPFTRGPVPYLETGRTRIIPGHDNTKVDSLPSYNIGAGPTNGVFKNWETDGLHFEFVLFERREEVSNQLLSWTAVYHDLRPDRNNNYFTLNRGLAPISTSIHPADPRRAQTRAMDDRVRYRRVEAKMEFHNSTSFLFGNEAKKAEIGEIFIAKARTGKKILNGSETPKQLWNWATDTDPESSAMFVWLPSGNAAVAQMTVNKGLRPFGVDSGTATGNRIKAGFWNIETGTTYNGQKTFKLWDDRTWAFPKAP